jgi:hypothetical protein
VDLFFADDAVQNKPSRRGMGPIVAIGGIHVPSEVARELEKQLNSLCSHAGFPDGEEFKWSPGRDLWMARHLVDADRQDFFRSVLDLLNERGVKVIVVAEDISRSAATPDAPSRLIDVSRLLIERIDNQLRRAGKDIVIIVDSPPGDRAAEKAFLANCYDTLQHGTSFVKPQRIALNVLSTSSKLVRLVQAADLVTSCTVAVVSGEDRFAPPVFERVKPLLYEDGGRIGGVGLKLHPDLVFVNLYHWLVGDEYYRRGNTGWGLPRAQNPYAKSALVP